MKISVTQKNIDDGEEGSYSKCPVALAIQEIYCFPVMVGWEKVKKRITLDDRTEGWGYAIGIMPSDVGVKIRKFDEGFGMMPFEFELI